MALTGKTSQLLAVEPFICADTHFGRISRGNRRGAPGMRQRRAELRHGDAKLMREKSPNRLPSSDLRPSTPSLATFSGGARAFTTFYVAPASNILTLN